MINKNQKGSISVIIPTYNSGRNLSKVLDAIKSQDYPQNKLEILVIDGGSTDDTIQIAKKYDCKIIKNPKTLQVYAKQMGVFEAKGEYIVHLDSDEVIKEKDSFKKKIKLFEKNKKLKAILSTGYETPKNVSTANIFVNEFGDPFSYFLFRSGVNPHFFINDLKKIATVNFEDKEGVAFDFSNIKFLPPIELSALSVIIERKFLIEKISNLRTDPSLVSQAFYLFVESQGLIGITKNDNIYHFSVKSWPSYFKKIRSRVINNVYLTEMGKSALGGRGKFYSNSLTIKKYLFIPYSLSFVFPLLDGINLSFTRKNPIFLLFPFICLYILILVLYFSLLKAIGIKPKFRGYGQ